MTIKEYIQTKLQAFNVNASQMLDMALLTNIDEEVTADNIEGANKAMINLIEELCFAPKMKSISESGFSMSWDMDNLGKWYLWLCRKYGIKPNDDVLAMLGISTIIDKTDIW